MRTLLLLILFAATAFADQPGYVVNVTNEHGRFIDHGTGTLVHPQFVLTCSHNVDILPEGDTTVTFKNGDVVKATVYRRNALMDLLLLKLETIRYEKPLAISTTRAEAGDTVTAKGFPGTGGVYREYTGNVAPDIISIGNIRGSVFRVIDTPVRQGVSGGPVIRDGKLVGVLWGSTLTGFRATHVTFVHQLMETIK